MYMLLTAIRTTLIIAIEGIFLDFPSGGKYAPPNKTYESGLYLHTADCKQFNYHHTHGSERVKLLCSI